MSGRPAAGNDLRTHPVHLGLGAKALPQPEFGGMPWYQDYAMRTAADGVEGRLVALHEFDRSWDGWEMHPAGDELVVCLAGEMTLIQELVDGSFHAQALKPFEYAVNAAGVWHTADIGDPATALFITAGQGTEHRPR